MRRFYRILIIVLLAFPVFNYGPLLWKDGSYAGRWDFVADMEARPTQCWGPAFILQICEISFPDRTNNRMVKLNYVIVGADWHDCVTDIVRSSTGHITSMITITGSAIHTRTGAFIALIMVAFLLERFLLFATHRALLRRAAAAAPSPGARVREATLLSRDRRDRLP